MADRPAAPNTEPAREQVWLAIGENTSIGVDRDEAMALDRAGFVALYRKCVYPPPGLRARRAWRRDAEAWADTQIAHRAAALAARGVSA